MLREQARFFRNGTIFLDILVVSIAFLLAHYFSGMVGGGGETYEYALMLSDRIPHLVRSFRLL